MFKEKRFLVFGAHPNDPDLMFGGSALKLISAKIAGLSEYQVLDNHDGTLEASLENRMRIVKIIREFKPDVVISHRINDYYPDHRATAQLIQDASFLVMVPLYTDT